MKTSDISLHNFNGQEHVHIVLRMFQYVNWKTSPKYIYIYKTNKLMVENTHLPLPVCSVNKDDIFWQMFVRVQDLIELIVH